VGKRTDAINFRGVILFYKVIWFYQIEIWKPESVENPPDFLGKKQWQVLFTIEKQRNMQQQTEEHIRRSNPDKVAAAGPNLTRGDEKHKQNIYFILIWHKTQMWVKIFLRKF